MLPIRVPIARDYPPLYPPLALRGFGDDFGGKAVDGKWNIFLTGSATTSMGAGAPSRVILDTGTTNNSQAALSENGIKHWSISEGGTFFTRAKLPTLTTVAVNTALASVDATNYIQIIIDTNAGDTNARLKTVNAGTVTSVDMGAIDANWHEYVMVVRAGDVRARIDSGAVYQSITNVPTGDFETYINIVNRAAVARTIEFDYHYFLPGYYAF